ILHADDAKFTKRLSNQRIICQGNPLLIDFAIASLLNKGAIEDLSKTKKLQYFADLWLH
ncbi:mCG140332, partial [Mus musculus]